MARFQHVLAATDLSAPARHAAHRAASVARAVGAGLDLVYVASTTAFDAVHRYLAALPARLPQRWLDEAEAALHAFAATLEREHGLVAGVHFATGPVLEQIGRVRSETAADLVVVGARGASFLRQMVLGSTAERLVGTATLPMLVVKQVAHRPYASVLVAVDFSDASLAALRCARAIAPGARIRVLHAFETPFEGKLRSVGAGADAIDSYRIEVQRDASEGMAALYERAGMTLSDAEGLVAEGDPVWRVLEQEQEQDCDLVVVGKRQSRTEDFFLGSVSRRVLAESQCDVLIAT